MKFVWQVLPFMYAKDGFLLHTPYVAYTELPYLFAPLFFQTKDIGGANRPLI